jgi:phytanoyl-CoA hydroxylase
MGLITQDQLHHFEEEGYLLVRGLLDVPRVIEPVVREYEGVLDSLAHKLHAAGEISSTYADLPFAERLIKVYGESGKVHQQYFDFSLPQSGVKADTPFWAGPAVFDALCDPDLLDAVESFIGPEIYSNPVQHVRIKLPEDVTPINPDTGRIQLGITPWHQDNGVVLPEADQTQMLTVWFPLTKATEEHGCLAVLPRSHRQGLRAHCPGPWGLEVPEKVLARQGFVPLPMEPGDVLFLTAHTLHSSLANKSDEIRWSFDLRYHPIGQPTGRPAFPGFVARSQADPSSELHEAAAWHRLWQETRDRLVTTEDTPFNRWSATDPVCA